MIKTIFIGTNHFAAKILEDLIKKNIINHIFTKPDNKIGRGQKLTPYPVKIVGEKYKIDTCTQKSINNKNIINNIKKLAPDLIITCEYSEKICKKIIDIPKLGTINIHPSLLPKYRGPAPIENAILNNEKETGISIIKINEFIDSGDIIAMATCKILKKDTYESLTKKLIKLSNKQLLCLISRFKKDKIISIKQNENNATYAPKIEKKDFKINWNDTANNINNKIRALSGKRYANSNINNTYIKILNSTIINNILLKNNKPGYIIKIGKLGIDVSTKDNVLRIKKLQISGRRPITAKEILNSKQKVFTIGNKFD
ncbi:MAG TPA: methionyl-tRNA formyltransferase [Candidatus Azoamicus sp. OHIO1]